MHAIAGTKDVATGDALVALHKIESAAGNDALHAPAKTHIPPGTAQIEGIATQKARARGAVPVAGDDVDVDTPVPQRRQRALDKTLSAAERVVALTNEGELQRASNSRAAASTGATGSVTRQSLILPPP